MWIDSTSQAHGVASASGIHPKSCHSGFERLEGSGQCIFATKKKKKKKREKKRGSQENNEELLWEFLMGGGGEVSSRKIYIYTHSAENLDFLQVVISKQRISKITLWSGGMMTSGWSATESGFHLQHHSSNRRRTEGSVIQKFCSDRSQARVDLWSD